MLTALLTILVVLAILSVICWGISRLPLVEPFRTVAIVIVAVIGLIWLLTMIPGAHIPG